MTEPQIHGLADAGPGFSEHPAGTAPNSPPVRPLPDAGPGWATNVPHSARYATGGPIRRPMPDGGPGHITHTPPPGASNCTSGLPRYASGAAPIPLVLRCSMSGCPSAIAMPPGSTEQQQADRLTAAGWDKHLTGGWVCPSPRDHAAVPAPRRADRHAGRRRSPFWARLMVAVGLYLLMALALLIAVATFNGPVIVFVAGAVLLAVAWSAFLVRRWRRR